MQGCHKPSICEKHIKVRHAKQVCLYLRRLESSEEETNMAATAKHTSSNTCDNEEVITSLQKPHGEQ